MQVGTWINGFGFQMMPDEALHRVRSSLRMLVFPGTSILQMPLQAAPIPSDPPPSLWTVRCFHRACIQVSVATCKGNMPAYRVAEACAWYA